VTARRHPAEVTSDRLLEHYEKLYDRFEASEREAIGKVRYALQRIADEDDNQ
jgi:hypothetical protein